jgi:hypothetical protein
VFRERRNCFALEKPDSDFSSASAAVWEKLCSFASHAVRLQRYSISSSDIFPVTANLCSAFLTMLAAFRSFWDRGSDASFCSGITGLRLPKYRQVLP